MLKPQSLIYSFVGRHCLGNAHLLFDAPVTEAALSAASLRAPDTFCIGSSDPWTHDDVTPLVYINGARVEFCGSALVALSAILEGAKYKTLKVRGQAVELCRAGNRPAFEADAIALGGRCRRIKPGLWPSIVGAELEACWQYAGGYVIAVLKPGTSLITLSPKLNDLTRHSRSALIVTALTRQRNADYQLRYFAPQFGVDEDQATGSANMIAMRFWHRQLRRRHWVAYQASPAGGLIYGTVKGRHVRVAGDVLIQSLT